MGASRDGFGHKIRIKSRRLQLLERVGGNAQTKMKTALKPLRTKNQEERFPEGSSGISV